MVLSPWNGQEDHRKLDSIFWINGPSFSNGLLDNHIIIFCGVFDSVQSKETPDNLPTTKRKSSPSRRGSNKVKYKNKKDNALFSKGQLSILLKLCAADIFNFGNDNVKKANIQSYDVN